MEKFILLIGALLGTFAIPSQGKQSEEIDLSYLGKKIFGQPKTSTGEKVKNWSRNSTVNPEELGEYFEGDILVPVFKKNGMINKFYRWKDGVIPYEIIGPFSAQDIWMINAAFEQYNKFTCIKLRKRTSSDRDYVIITNTNTGCWSSIGRIGGPQQLNFQSPGCLYDLGTPIHEIMHTVGFMHEQSRPERDDYVTIFWRNIVRGMEGNFNKASRRDVSGFGVGYDYDSVMHYSSDAFTRNGEATILPKKRGVKIGQRDGFSQGDIQKINKMYGCKETRGKSRSRN